MYIVKTKTAKGHKKTLIELKFLGSLAPNVVVSSVWHLNEKCRLGIWRLKFGVWRLKSGVWRLKSGVWRPKFGDEYLI